MNQNSLKRTEKFYFKILIELIGSKWTIPTIFVLQHSSKRYSQIHKLVPETTQKVLTATLRKLQRNGIIFRTVHPTSPPQVEYQLSPMGIELLDTIKNMTQWAENNHQKIKRAQKAYDNE